MGVALALKLCAVLALLGLLTSGAKLNTGWLVPSGQVKIDQQLLREPKLKVCALTFDDGPDEKYTEQVLAVLNKHKVRATFFLVGKNVSGYKKQVLSIHEAGHEIANHSWSHPNMKKLSKSKQYEQIAKSNDAFAALGITPRWFRPPYGEFNNTTLAAARDHGLETILWSVDPQDWMKPGAEKIKSRVLKAVSPGGVILLHSTNAQTVEMLPGMLDKLKQEGYTFLTMSQWREAVTGKLDFATLQTETMPRLPDAEIVIPSMPESSKPAPPKSTPRTSPEPPVDTQGKFSVHSNFAQQDELPSVFSKGGQSKLKGFDHHSDDTEFIVNLALSHEAHEAEHAREHEAGIEHEHEDAGDNTPPVISLQRSGSAGDSAVINEAPAETAALDPLPLNEPEASPAPRYIEPAPAAQPEPEQPLQRTLLASYALSDAPALPWLGSDESTDWYIAHLGSASRFDDVQRFAPYIKAAGLSGLLLAGNKPLRPGPLPFNQQESIGQPELSQSIDLSRDGIAEVLALLQSGASEIYLTLAPDNAAFFLLEGTALELPQASRDLLLLRLMTRGMALDRQWSAVGWQLPAGMSAARFVSGGSEVVVLYSGNAQTQRVTLPQGHDSALLAGFSESGELALFDATGVVEVSRSPAILYYNRAQ